MHILQGSLIFEITDSFPSLNSQKASLHSKKLENKKLENYSL